MNKNSYRKSSCKLFRPGPDKTMRAKLNAMLKFFTNRRGVEWSCDYTKPVWWLKFWRSVRSWSIVLLGLAAGLVEYERLDFGEV